MKLTQERLAEIKRGANCGLLSDVPLLELLELLDHIRSVEAERDQWRTMAGRLAEQLEASSNGFPYSVMRDYDALIAREGGTNEH